MFKWVWDDNLNCFCAEHNKTIRADKNGNVFGGGSTKIEQPAAPAAPTVTSSMTDYINNYPRLFSLMQQYAPQEAAMQVNLAQQYAQPLGQAYKSAQEAMYPEETAITKSLNEQVQQGMAGGLPDWAKQSYMDTMRAQLGDNALSGAGADYMSRGLLETQKNWQDYYRNLGLSITGSQPVYGAQSPSYTNQMQAYTPNSAMGFNQGVYGTQANIYGTQMGAAMQNSQQKYMQPFMYMQGIGNVTQGIGSMMGGAGGGAAAAASSKRYKTNIKSWVKH